MADRQGVRASERERKRERETERERERGRRVRERDAALSHDRARCNARAAMHKQRRASRSAPAKVTRVMSRCPLCRTNSATRPKAHSAPAAAAATAVAAAGRREGGGGGGNRAAPLRPLVPPPPSGIRYREARGRPAVKARRKRWRERARPRVMQCATLCAKRPRDRAPISPGRRLISGR